MPVFFDATGTQLSSGELSNGEFYWEFGDLASTHNRATGFAVGHVFENPGFYTVKLVIQDVTGPKVLTSTKITVNPFAGATYYVSSATGSDQNNGLSEASPYKTVGHALGKLGSILQNSKSAVRLLFRRGDQFTFDGYNLMRVTGSPAILAAYGSGPKPVFQATPTNSVVLDFMGDVAGFRLVDLEFRGNYNFSQRTGPNQTLISLGPDSGDFLLYRCVLRRATGGFSMAGGTGLREVFVVDSTFDEFGYAACYVAGKWLSIIGNSMAKSATRHILRVWNADRAFISRNVLHYPSVYQAGGLALKLHADNGPGRYVTVSENDFKGGQYVVGFSPQNIWTTEYLDHIVFEKNVVRPDATTVLGLAINANDVTIRNNLFLADVATNWDDRYSAVLIESHSTMPGASRIRAYNNTCCDLRNGPEVAFLRIGPSDTTDVRVHNNLLYAPNSTNESVALEFNNSPSALTVDNNIWFMPKTKAAGPANGPVRYTWTAWRNAGKDVHGLSSDPLLIDPTSGTFRPSSSSPAIDAGAGIAGAFEAIDCERRPLGTATDIGAYETIRSGQNNRFALVADPGDPTPGGKVKLSISAPQFVQHQYHIALAFGTHPAIRFHRELSIPLTADPLFYLSVLANPAAMGLQDFVGTLDGSGAGSGTMTLPASPILRGLVFYSAAAVRSGVDYVGASCPVQIKIK